MNRMQVSKPNNEIACSAKFPHKTDFRGIEHTGVRGKGKKQLAMVSRFMPFKDLKTEIRQDCIVQ